MSRRAGLLSFSFSLVFAACRVLPDIEPGICGNHVLEAGEACDGFGRGEARCRPPGAAGQCRLDCSSRADGSRPSCPSGHGCDAAGICRRATGGYSIAGAPVAGNAFALSAHDFDGDGRADVLSEEAAGGLGARKLRVHYFERAGGLRSTWLWPGSVADVAAAPVSDDDRSDIVLTDSRVGVLLGQSDRTLISETYATYALPDTPVRIAGALGAGNIGGTAALLVVSQAGDDLIIERPDASSGMLEQIASLPGSIDALAGAPVIGDLFAARSDDPCLDLAIAVRGTREAHVYSVCTRAGDGGIAWREIAEHTRVPLMAAGEIEGGPLLADVDGDGHLDLTLEVEGTMHVAFGDGASLAPARPWTARFGDDSTAVPMPLAAGDFNADGAADLVFPSRFWHSRRGESRDDLGYSESGTRFGAVWSEARIADLNGNGLPDVVAASRDKLDIDFYNGTGGDHLNAFVIPTERPVEQLAIGDFDGDLIHDLAFLQLGAANEPHRAMVAFGAHAGPPSSPVTAASARDVMQLGALGHAASDAAAVLFLAYTQPGPDGREGSAFAWLSGADRSLMCMVELTTFAADGSIQAVPALAVALGSFVEAGRHDAVLVTSRLQTPELELWWLPDLRGRFGRPGRLGWGLPPELAPLRGFDTAPELQLLMAAGDVDGDELDELVLAAPDAEDTHCVLVIAEVEAADGGRIVPVHAMPIDARCGRSGQLAIDDLDGDSAAEILLLTGEPGKARTLLVAWNDGQGGFSQGAVNSLTQPDDTPQAFVSYRPRPRERARLAYVTETQLRVLQAARTRGFEQIARAPELELSRATGIAAGDVDGDGVTDLLLADSGQIQLLLAELEP